MDAALFFVSSVGLTLFFIVLGRGSFNITYEDLISTSFFWGLVTLIYEFSNLRINLTKAIEEFSDSDDETEDPAI